MTLIIPITDLRRRFGAITSRLPTLEEIILTRGGEPFATLKATSNVKKKAFLELAGSFKGTDLDNDKVWAEVLKRKSRSRPVDL